ncbi:MAG: DUF1456 family protein, partial [Fusobacterium sp.]|nr:DUF1456 family protein [Fusobacterium sp.]
MTNNDFLRRLRYALNIKDYTMVEIFKLADKKVSREEITGFLKKDFEEGFIKINNKDLNLFLDGLIILKRGKRENSTKK